MVFRILEIRAVNWVIGTKELEGDLDFSIRWVGGLDVMTLEI